MSSFNLPNRPSQPALFSQPPPPKAPPLAPDWTEHKAPTGHSYYYNTATKTSTYTRPVATASAPAPFAVGPVQPTYNPSYGPYNGNLPPQQYLKQQQFPPRQFGNVQNYSHGGMSRGGRFESRHPRLQGKPKGKPDRPKSKRAIPGATPWVLVTTKLGRKFIHNPDTKVSLWKASKDVQVAIEKMPLENEAGKEPRAKKVKVMIELGEKVIENGGEPQGGKRPVPTDVGTGDEEVPKKVKVAGEEEGGGNEYEDEDSDEDEGEEYVEEEEGHDNKRLKTGDVAPMEFTEEDIAWQLKAMAEQYGLGEEDLEEGEEMTEEENISLFKEMLNDYRIDPYSTWDSEMPRIVEDNRYILVSTTRLRKEIFTEWCRDRIAELRAEKEKAKKVDPRIPFWAFLKENASIKLYWPEFKRKLKKVPEMRDTKLTDKEKEKMYRDYITYIKTSESTRENGLKKLLKSTPGMCRSTSLDDLPESILSNVYYVTVPEKMRDVIIKDHLANLPEALRNEEEKKLGEERERKERALRDRGMAVRKEQWRLRGEEQRAKDMLREEEAMIERAKIVGKKGLLGHIIKKEEGGREEEKTPKPCEVSKSELS